MRFNEIGQQLRAYRMESGLKAEEISARLGVPALLYTATKKARLSSLIPSTAWLSCSKSRR